MTLTLTYATCMIPAIMLISFILRQSHLLMSLMALEGVMLSLVMFLPMVLSSSYMSLEPMCIILLTMGACEAGLGLALMVTMTRHHGSDLLKSLTLNKC